MKIFSNNQIKRMVHQKINEAIAIKPDETIKVLFEEVYGLTTIHKGAISQNNRARLKRLKKELIALKKDFQTVLAEIMADYKPLKPSIFNKQLLLTEKEFEKFLESKKIMTAEQYLNKIAASYDPDYYQCVEAILLYDKDVPIYQIKKGKQWAYDSVQATNRRYVYFKSHEKMVQHNNLEIVERAAFKDYVENYLD